MGILEVTVQSEIRQAVCKLGWARLVRNNTGKVKDEDGQYHVFGLGKGGCDLVGWVQMPDGVARVFAVEVKRPKGGRTSAEQVAWITAVNKNGGVAGVCRSPEQAVALAERARSGEFFTGCGPFPL